MGRDESAEREDGRFVLFGAYLTELRQSRGLGQRQLAARLGIDHTLLTRWEAGATRPSPERLRRCATELRCSSSEWRRLADLAGYTISGVSQPEDPEFMKLASDADLLQHLYDDAVAALGEDDQSKARGYLSLLAAAFRTEAAPDVLELKAKTFSLLSELLVWTDQLGPALEASNEAARVASLTGDVHLEQETAIRTGLILHKMKRNAAALRFYQRARQHRLPSLEAHLALSRNEAAACWDLRAFDESQEIAKEAMRTFEKKNDWRNYTNLLEIYCRALGTAAVGRPTDKMLKAAAQDARELESMLKVGQLSGLEELRVHVISFKMSALSGDLDRATHYAQTIIRKVRQAQLWMELNCFESIAHEVLNHRGSPIWLEAVPLVRSIARGPN